MAKNSCSAAARISSRASSAPWPALSNPAKRSNNALPAKCARKVGIEITNLRYFNSQPWPFPNSLMIAFFADYAGGTITPDPKEIEAAEWFHLDALPILPEPISISRRLIDAAMADRQKRSDI